MEVEDEGIKLVNCIEADLEKVVKRKESFKHQDCQTSQNLYMNPVIFI